MPEISVIVPIFNAEKYLTACIESIIGQTYPNFELLLVDDGSTDQSRNVCEQYQQRDQRIKVIHQSNNGVTKARKTGWQKSEGNWIVFADADDLAHSDLLEVLITTALENDCDIVNASFQSVPGGRKWVHKKLGLMNRQEYLESFLNNQTFGVVYASIYKKPLLHDNTFEFDPGLKIGEDVLMNIELALRTQKAVNIENIVYDYTDNETSVMNRKVQHPTYFERYYQAKENLFRKANLPDELFEVIQSEKFNAQLKALYSPFIKFDVESYKKLQRDAVQFSSSYHESAIDRIQTFGLKSKLMALLVKQLLKWLFRLKNIMKGNFLPKREVLY